jgi:hypothetical protein
VNHFRNHYFGADIKKSKSASIVSFISFRKVMLYLNLKSFKKSFLDFFGFSRVYVPNSLSAI